MTVVLASRNPKLYERPCKHIETTMVSRGRLPTIRLLVLLHCFALSHPQATAIAQTSEVAGIAPSTKPNIVVLRSTLVSHSEAPTISSAPLHYPLVSLSPSDITKRITGGITGSSSSSSSPSNENKPSKSPTKRTHSRRMQQQSTVVAYIALAVVFLVTAGIVFLACALGCSSSCCYMPVVGGAEDELVQGSGSTTLELVEADDSNDEDPVAAAVVVLAQEDPPMQQQNIEQDDRFEQAVPVAATVDRAVVMAAAGAM